MANEITVGMSLTVNNGYLQGQFTPSAIRANQTTAGVSGGGQTLTGATPEIIIVTDISTAGWSAIRNLSTTETIQIGTGAGTNFAATISCLPGEAAVFRAATTSLYGKVTTTNNAAIQVTMYAA